MRDSYLKLLVPVTLLTVYVNNNISIAQEFNSSARFKAAKSRIQKSLAKQGLLNNKKLNVYQGDNRKVVIGTMINRRNIYVAGQKAHATGTQLNVGVTTKKTKNRFAKEDKITELAGERADVKGTQGSVYIRLKTINSGHITANAKGNTSAEAYAIGNKITVEGARGVVDIRTHTVNRGNITAYANAHSNVEVEAITAKTNIEGKPRLVRVRGAITSNGNVTAKAIGGVAAALEMAGEL